MPPRKTAAWPLALAYIGLVVYASLYPFDHWRDQGVVPWTFMLQPLPKYWTGFDVATNIVGYMPLGFLLVLAALRTGRARFAVLNVTLALLALSCLMEGIQNYLPNRVSSNVDWALNGLGAWLGGGTAWLMEKMGAIDHWSQLRQRWFAPDARGALVLLALWPLALLFPAAVPFGLGQVYERLETALGEALQDTPFLEWLPLRTVELQPLVPAAELVCVVLGLMIPCLLGYSVIRVVWRRAVFLVAYLLLAVFATALSAALSWGPDHAFAWLSFPVQVGLNAAIVLALSLLVVSRRSCVALLLLALVLQLALLNQAPANPYFAQTLSNWEQGRFIRFHGLAQWLGWFWPYVALLYTLSRLSRRDAVA